jgi:hypothetical protein
MGASQFGEYGYGRTASEAFTAAREQAAWEYGHGGYTGSLAEKPGAVLLPELPARWTTQTVEQLISEAEFGASYKAANGQWKTRKGSAEKAQQKLDGWLRGTTWNHARLVAAYNAKWESALCLLVPATEERKHRATQGNPPKPRGRSLYYFFGLASS